MKWIELLQSFIYQIACLKQFRLLKIRFNLETNWNFFWNSLSLFTNTKVFPKLILSMKRFGMFHTLKYLPKKHKFLINRCSMWNELKYFKFPKVKKLAEKTQSFLDPIHSRKWIEIVYKFLAPIACLKISKCLWDDSVYK